MSVVDQEIPEDLWNEEGDRVWIRYDLCTSASKARYMAWTGRGLPIGFREMGAISLIMLEVRVVWAKLDPTSEWDEWPWKLCARGDEGARKFWQVS